MPSLTPATITTLFWILFSVEAVAAVAGLVAVFGAGGRTGPEGPVGAWVIFLPPLALAVAFLVFRFAQSDGVRISVVAFLAFPLVIALLGPVRTAILDFQVNRSLRGDDAFRSPAHRSLGRAIHAQNPEAVRAAIPAAGNLNEASGGETFLRFALVNAAPPGKPEEKASLEIVQAILNAGADPNAPAFESNWPLTLAILHSPEMTSLLLDAGADPNRLDGAQRPLWWDALTATGRAETLELLLSKGAKIPIRDGESGPAAYAAHNQQWDAAWRLVQAGAAWDGEQRYGTTVVYMLQSAMSYRSDSKEPLPESMRELLKRCGLGQVP